MKILFEEITSKEVTIIYQGNKHLIVCVDKASSHVHKDNGKMIGLYDVTHRKDSHQQMTRTIKHIQNKGTKRINAYYDTTLNCIFISSITNFIGGA